jgi:hypothetical protein
MKKALSVILAVLAIVAVIAPEERANAQAYCGHCCGTDPWGNPVVGCTLVSVVPCGNNCWCNNVPGTGFACY